jgi:hypothetical protein
MTEKQLDPPRMFELDEVPPELRRWLGLANADALTNSQIDRLAGSFEQRICSGDFGNANLPPGSAAGHSRRWADRIESWLRTSAGRLTVLVAVLGVGAAGTVGVVRQRDRLFSRAVPTAAGAGVLVPAPASGPSAAVLDHSSAVEPRIRGASATPPIDARPVERSHGPQFSAPTSLRSSAVSQSGSATPNTPRLDSGQDSADEYRLVRAARQAASIDPASALALTDEHLRRFPHGMLGQERETIAIEALARLGNAAAARKRADRFLATYPTSPYAKRIQAAVGNSPRVATP